MSTTVTEANQSSGSRRLQAGGTLNPRKHIYIQRPEDEEVLRLLLAGEYVNVLTSRQMGKSSLMAKTAYALQEQGVRFVSVDLAGELGSGDDPALYYQALLQKVARSLELPVDLKAWWQERAPETNNQKLLRFFKDVVGGAIEAPVVVFLDEIDSTLKLPFTDDLFTALRTMNNERGFEAAYQRLTFCLLGVATPNELIKDRRTTPYNVGQTLELRDFDAERDDLTALALALNPDLETGRALLARVLHWTGGHPYLTNRLCHDLAAAGVQSTDEVNHHVDDVFRTLERVGGDVHFQQILRFVEERFTKELDSLDLYARILKGARERDQPSLAHTELKLSGLVKRDNEGCLIVRNPIYARLFDQAWVKSTKPKRTLARTRSLAIAASVAVGLLAGGGILYQVLVVGPGQQALAIRQQLEELRITIAKSNTGDGLSIQFPEATDQNLLAIATPLLLALPEDVIEIDMQAQTPWGNTVEVTDPAPLAQFRQLEMIDLEGSQISSIEPLAELDAMRRLYLSYTQVSDIEPIVGLAAVQDLTLAHTKVTDVSALKGLPALQTLDLSNTQVADISALKGLAALKWLDLSNTLVSEEAFAAFKQDLAERGITMEFLVGPDGSLN